MDNFSSSWGQDTYSNGSTTDSRSSTRITEHATNNQRRRLEVCRGLRTLERKGSTYSPKEKNQTAILPSSSPSQRCGRCSTPPLTAHADDGGGMSPTTAAARSQEPEARGTPTRVVHPLGRTLSHFWLGSAGRPWRQKGRLRGVDQTMGAH